MKRSLLLLLLVPFTAFAQRVTIRGRVTDAANKPVEFATVSILETNYATYTDTAGRFHFSIDRKQLPSLTIRVSVVNKQSAESTIAAADYDKPQFFKLEDLSLSLKEVVVSARQKRSEVSNSSVIFDRQAIEQIQAYSLADVLNNLPGKTTTAPDLQYRQNVTLRTASSQDPTQQRMNSMGVAIYIDGIRMSNDANMQSRGIGGQGISGALITNTRDPYNGNPSYDTPFSGIDIRNIPVDNIESIEVVSGVASAKYGELTDGAIFIRTKAARTPFNATVRMNGSSVNTSLSKGFSLGRKAGDINANINYLNSVQDPTNSLKNYGRVNGGLKWTKAIGRGITNTFSTDFSYKIDNRKIDPDDDLDLTAYSKESRVGLTNRTSLRTDGGFINSASLNLSYDVGYQESFSGRNINSAPLAVADKDTTGVYEGYFAPGTYYATEHIIGRPYNGSAGLDLNSVVTTGGLRHQLSYGANMFMSGNTGVGILADPTRPPSNSIKGRSDRPYDFDLQRPILNFGFYAEDRVNIKVLKRDLTVSGGLRYDLQNGFPNIQPRINSSYQFNKHWSFRAAYGISTKSPGMSYRYPAPSYFDVPLYTYFNGKANESIFLVYTKKVVPDNGNLKPSRSSQIELGLSADYKFINSSIFGYYKKNTDGFNVNASYLPVSLPFYTVAIVAGQKPIATKTDSTYLYAGLSNNVVGNFVRSDNYGIEFFLSTKKIASIQTSFSLTTSFAYSEYNNTGTTVSLATKDKYENDGTAWYGVYNGSRTKNTSLASKLNIDTHIPSLGFVVSLTTDVSWLNLQQNLGRNNYPIAFIDGSGKTTPITVYDPADTRYNFLVLKPDATNRLLDPPFFYANMSLRLAKEIRKNVRVSLFAYNFLDTKIQYHNTTTNSISTYNSPVNVGVDLSFKF